jgi:hypothetical protein
MMAESMGILAAIVIALLAQQPAVQASASINGVVVAPGTSQPIAKAVVELQGGGRDERLTVATGVNGRFEFLNLPAGSYRLTATRTGYLDTAFGQRGPSGSGRELRLAAGVNQNDITLLMTATGAISGRVLDDTGEPLANIPVQALRYSYVDGQRTLKPIKIDETNDLGEFRVFWLPPGQYYISAQPRKSSPGKFIVLHDDGDLSGRMRGGNEADSAAQKLGEAHVPVYYPGTTAVQSATQVEVRPGADVRGIDFTLARVRTKKIRGLVVDSTTGQPVNANVQLVPRGDSTTAFAASYAPTDGGRFEIAGALPGSYYVIATARLGPSDDIRIMGGRTAVDVGGSDVDNLAVTLRPAIDITGTLTVEGRADGLPRDFHPVLTLQGRDGFLPGVLQSHASFANSTQFEFGRVVEGEYKVLWPNLPPGMYLKSVKLGPADALDGMVHIDWRTTDRFQIILGADSGTLEGVVVDRNRNPLAGARVVLVPDVPRRQRADLFRTTTSDDFGRYRLQGIAPGSYSLFAWEDIENGLWQDAEFLRRNEASGKPVRITESSSDTLETLAIPSAF